MLLGTVTTPKHNKIIVLTISDRLIMQTNGLDTVRRILAIIFVIGIIFFLGNIIVIKIIIFFFRFVNEIRLFVTAIIRGMSDMAVDVM